MSAPQQAKQHIKPFIEIKGHLFPMDVIVDAYLIVNDPKWNQGYANGYVRVTKEHPWYKECEKDYPHIPSRVHGGITYHAINHQEDNAVIGFDTRHLGDNPTAQDSVYCITQLHRLAWDALEVYTAHKRRIDSTIDRIQNMSIEELREELTKCLTE